MATGATSRLRQAVKLAVALLVVGPLLVHWGVVGTDLVPTVSVELLLRAAGLGVVTVVLGLLVRQKRGTRGQRSSADAPEHAEDRRGEDLQVEGSGEAYASYAYHNQEEARREGERIRERAEEIADAERDAARRRDEGRR